MGVLVTSAIGDAGVVSSRPRLDIMSRTTTDRPQSRYLTIATRRLETS